MNSYLNDRSQNGSLTADLQQAKRKKTMIEQIVTSSFFCKKRGKRFISRIVKMPVPVDFSFRIFSLLFHSQNLVEIVQWRFVFRVASPCSSIRCECASDFLSTSFS